MFVTPRVERVYHARHRIQGFELPEVLRGPGVYPRPYALEGPFLHRFPEDGRNRIEASILHQSLAWLQNINNRVAGFEDDAYAAGALVDDAVHTLFVVRTHVYQVCNILSTRYEVLWRMRTGHDVAANMHDAILGSHGPGWSNTATAGLISVAASARLSNTARDSGRTLGRRPGG